MSLSILRFTSLAFFLGAISTLAAPLSVPIVNSGFEALTGTDPIHFDADHHLRPGHGSVVTGWPVPAGYFPSVAAIPGWSSALNVGTVNPQGGSVAEGQNVAWMNVDGAISQVLTTSWSAGSVYRSRVDFAASPGRTASISLGLYANGQLVSETRAANSSSTSKFTTLTCSCFIPVGSEFDGFPIEVRIRSLAGSTGAFLDDVRLESDTLTGCLPPPSGLVAWWRGSSAMNLISGIQGEISPGLSIGDGISGKGFVFDGGEGALRFREGLSISSQEFTLEGWIKRSDTNRVSASGSTGAILGSSVGALNLFLSPQGALSLGVTGFSVQSSSKPITDTNWHHIAVTREGGNNRYYVDGALTDVLAASGAYPASGPMAIGNGVGAVGGPTGFLGSIDELSVYNRSLSGVEIQGIARQGSLAKCGPDARLEFAAATLKSEIGVPLSTTLTVLNDGASDLTKLVITNAFPPGLDVLEFAANLGIATAGRTNLLWTLDVLPPGQKATLSFKIAAATNVDPSIVFAAGTYEFDGSRYSTPSSELRLEFPILPSPTPAGMVAWWRGENSAVDSAGTANGTIAGGLTYTQGMVGKAFRMNGTDAFIGLGNPASLHLSTLTIEGWIRRENPTLASQGYPNIGAILCSGLDGFGLAVLENGKLTISKVGVTRFDSTTAINDTAWHHIAVTLDGTRAAFYVDGIDAGGGNYAPFFSYNTAFSIGELGQYILGTGLEPFWGTIDELAVYNRALSKAEIVRIVNAKTAGKASAYVDVSSPSSGGVRSAPGETFGVKWSITNRWDADSTGFTLNIAIPTGLTVRNIAQPPGTVSLTNGVISWNPGLVPGHKNLEFLVVFTPNDEGDFQIQSSLQPIGAAALFGATQVVVPVSAHRPSEIRLSQPGVVRLPDSQPLSGVVQVLLDRPSHDPIQIQFSTQVHSPNPGLVIAPQADSFTIPAGVVSFPVPVSILPLKPSDPIEFAAEFDVRILTATGATVAGASTVVKVRGEPAILSARRNAVGEIEVRFHVVAGRLYELQRSESLLFPDWTFVGNAFVGEGESDINLPDRLASERVQQFYRLVVKPR